MTTTGFEPGPCVRVCMCVYVCLVLLVCLSALVAGVELLFLTTCFLTTCGEVCPMMIILVIIVPIISPASDYREHLLAFLEAKLNGSSCFLVLWECDVVRVCAL